MKFIKDKKMVKEVDARYQVQYDFQEWHDVDVEYAKKAGLSEGKLEMAKRQYEMKYHQDGEWIKDCSQEQLDIFIQFILTDIGYKELKEKVLLFL
ncbi:MAG: hypothetical protein KHZ15_03345 [Coprobacillus cateniformis]|uniref:hypothetical protein n=1 Tax=Longibaculum muris TaxID=1796628 RepID=UPI003AB6C2A8|nr:hypothetical protein [Coprobacillus cateniformis]